MQSLQNVLKAAHIDMTELYLDALESEEEGIVLDAVNLLGDIGSPAAIEGILRHQQRSVECSSLAALSALQGRYHESMRVKVLKALRDPNSDNRLLALAVLTEGKERQLAMAFLE